MKVNRTIRMDFELSQRLGKVCVRHGDITWHIERAVSQYLDSLCPIETVPSLIKKPRKPVQKRFIPPDREQAANYFFERGSPNAITESEKFIDFYQSKNWMVGKNKMKDWKAAIRNWMRKSAETSKPTSNQAQSPMKRLTDTSWAENLIEGDA